MAKYELREDYFELKPTWRYIVPMDKEERIRLIELLEKKGYTFAEEEWHNKQACIDSFLPIVVRTEEKTVSTTGNVTCAACAASAKMLMDVDTFINRCLNE